MSPAGGYVLDDPPWDAWEPGEVAERLRSVTAPWCVAAGWALDLFRGETTREHEDLEIAVPALGFPQIHSALSGYEFDVVDSDRRWPLDSEAFRLTYQTWVCEPATGIYKLDVFRDLHDGDTWICRRDERLRLPYRQIIATSAQGIPYLAPEIVLLFKAKHQRAKDESDFTGVLPMLDHSIGCTGGCASG
ncbi:MAG: nucleotidyltransferase domain-containing protein [Mycobacteriales bacterium]